MAFGLKVLLSITAPLLVGVTPSIAADFTYKEYAKEFGYLEAWICVFDFSAYVSHAAARRRGSISGEKCLRAMPRKLDGCCSCPSRRGICRKKSRQIQRADGSGRHANAVQFVSVGN